jgi:hypothetical protein
MAEALIVSCPFCRSEPGEPCRTSKGTGRPPHKIRVYAAEHGHPDAYRADERRAV